MSPTGQQYEDTAAALLDDLRTFALEVILVPAPDPHFLSHAIRVVVNRNPEWYRNLWWSEYAVKRCHLVAALERLADGWHPWPSTRYETLARLACEQVLEMEAAGVCRITGGFEPLPYPEQEGERTA